MEITGKQFRKRNAILDCLRQMKDHPSAESLYDALCVNHPDISRASVYRNLALFKEQGLIQSVCTIDGIERFDGCVDPHVHFICRKCGGIFDLHQIPIDIYDNVIDLPCGKVEKVQVSFSGICNNCQDNI